MHLLIWCTDITSKPTTCVSFHFGSVASSLKIEAEAPISSTCSPLLRVQRVCLCSSGMEKQGAMRSAAPFFTLYPLVLCIADWRVYCSWEGPFQFTGWARLDWTCTFPAKVSSNQLLFCPVSALCFIKHHHKTTQHFLWALSVCYSMNLNSTTQAARRSVPDSVGNSWENMKFQLHHDGTGLLAKSSSFGQIFGHFPLKRGFLQNKFFTSLADTQAGVSARVAPSWTCQNSGELLA